jgi:VanZ family protein
LSRHIPTPPARKRLRHFIALYALFLVVGSLHPYQGWASLSDWSLDFLWAPWPRYITRTDLATNLLVYTPLGYSLALWFSMPGRRTRGVLLGGMAGVVLSFTLESTQQLLPGRIASNLDMLVNGLGAWSGALMALHHGRWIRAMSALSRWRERWFKAGAATNLGLGLLALWFVSQFSLLPISGIGWLHLHLRPFDHLPDSLAGVNSPWLLAQLTEIVAVGAFAACLLRPGRYVGATVLIFVSAFFTKLLAATILLRLAVVGGVLSLETLGAFLLGFWLLLMPAVSRHRHAVALAGLAVVILFRLALASNLFPPVSALNITGLAVHLGVLWPALALAWLLFAYRDGR